MSPSGKFFQFNIGSTISFQLKAGFASIPNDRSRPGNQLAHQQGGLENLKNRDLESKRPQQADFYEVIDPSIDESSDSMSEMYPAMIPLPERTAGGPALTPAEDSLDSSDAMRSYQRRIHQRHGYGKSEHMEYIQSYNRNGQKVVGVFELPSIDLVI